MNCIDCNYALNFEALGFIECKHSEVQNNTLNPYFDGKTHPRWCPLLQKCNNNNITDTKENNC